MTTQTLALALLVLAVPAFADIASHTASPRYSLAVYRAPNEGPGTLTFDSGHGRAAVVYSSGGVTLAAINSAGLVASLVQAGPPAAFTLLPWIAKENATVRQVISNIQSNRSPPVTSRAAAYTRIVIADRAREHAVISFDENGRALIDTSDVAVVGFPPGSVIDQQLQAMSSLANSQEQRLSEMRSTLAAQKERSSNLSTAYWQKTALRDQRAADIKNMYEQWNHLNGLANQGWGILTGLIQTATVYKQLRDGNYARANHFFASAGFYEGQRAASDFMRVYFFLTQNWSAFIFWSLVEMQYRGARDIANAQGIASMQTGHAYETARHQNEGVMQPQVYAKIVTAQEARDNVWNRGIVPSQRFVDNLNAVELPGLSQQYAAALAIISKLEPQLTPTAVNQSWNELYQKMIEKVGIESFMLWGSQFPNMNPWDAVGQIRNRPEYADAVSLVFDADTPYLAWRYRGADKSLAIRASDFEGRCTFLIGSERFTNLKACADYEKENGPDRRIVDNMVLPHVSSTGAATTAPGVLVGFSKGGRRTFVGYGSVKLPSANRSDGIFEMGSITKVFTSLLTALETGRSGNAEAFLDRPVSDVIPALASFWEGAPEKRRITLRQLASHTSGFPFRVPTEILPRDSDDFGLFFSALARAPLAFTPGTGWLYSNPGMALLGAAMTAISGSSFESQVARQITGPLGLEHTAKFPLGEHQQGYVYDEAKGRYASVPPTIAGAVNMPTGGLRTSGNDLLTFTEALARTPRGTPMGDAISLLKRQVVATPCPPYVDGQCGMGLGIEMWDGVYYKTGQTDGFFSTIAFVEDVAVIVSANQTVMPSVLPIAKRIVELMRGH